MTVGATATVLGGFWPQNGVNSLTQVSGEGEERRRIRQELGGMGMLRMREIIRALNGVAPGGTASKTIGRITETGELGGQRPIAAVSLINRATTAADVTEITTDFLTFTTNSSFGATPPANLDRNPLGTR
jgi:hypothetical protein